MAEKQPSPYDVHVGTRLRQRRVLLGFSQEKLGDQLSLTFQQIQKYEKGSNRIGAGRLYEMSQILDVPVGYFYDGLANKQTEVSGFNEDQSSYAYEASTAEDGLRLSKAFARIRDSHKRHLAIEVVEALSD